MARSKRISNEERLKLAEEYFQLECNENLERFTFVGLAKYISTKTGIEISEDTIRRCKTIRAYHDRLNTADVIPEVISAINVYRTLDIDAFLSQYNNIQSLRTALMLREERYYTILKKSAQAVAKYNSLSEQNTALEAQCTTLGQEKNAQAEQILACKDEMRTLERTIKIMRTILEDNLNTKMADKLLIEAGVLKIPEEDDTLSKNAEDFIVSVEDDIPATLKKHESRVIQGLFDKI